MSRQAKRILIWSGSVVGFTGALVGAAFLGIAMAKRDLPEAAGNSAQEPYPVGVIVKVGGEETMVFFAEEIQPLRDFWRANPSPEERLEAKAGHGGIQKLEGGIEVRTLSQENDVFMVDVLTGIANGTTGWIHLSQLPPQPDSTMPTEIDLEKLEAELDRLVESRKNESADEDAARESLDETISELADGFAAFPPETRDEIRRLFTERRLADWIRGHAQSLGRRVAGPDDVEILRRALIVMSMENCGIDYRDTLIALADLFVGAEEVGIDPKPVFAEVAEISTDTRTPGGCESVARMLREFETYAVVKERREKGKPY